MRLAAPVNCIPVIFSWMVFQEPEIRAAALQCHLSRSGHGAVMQPPLIITNGQQCNNDQFRWRENQGKFCHSTASSSSLVAVLVTINSEVQGLDIYLLLVTCCLATWWSLWRVHNKTLLWIRRTESRNCVCILTFEDSELYLSILDKTQGKPLNVAVTALAPGTWHNCGTGQPRLE